MFVNNMRGSSRGIF